METTIVYWDKMGILDYCLSAIRVDVSAHASACLSSTVGCTGKPATLSARLLQEVAVHDQRPDRVVDRRRLAHRSVVENAFERVYCPTSS